MQTALVTGAAGFIGSNLAETLLQRGYTVRGVDNFHTGREENLEPLRADDRFFFRQGDIRNANEMADLVDGVDCIFHQAAVPSVPRSVDDPVTTTQANCSGTATLLDLARERGVGTVIVASSSSVYGSTGGLPKVETMEPSPESPYALSKYFAEQLVLQFAQYSEMDTIALRYFNIFGPRQDPHGEYAAVVPKFINLMLAGEAPTIYGDGEQSRDFTYVDNVVEANILAAESDVSGEVFNIGYGGRVTVNELVTILNDLLDTEIDPTYDDTRPGDLKHSNADISKAKEHLGYEPETDVSEGLERTIQYFQNEYSK